MNDSTTNIIISFCFVALIYELSLLIAQSCQEAEQSCYKCEQIDKAQETRWLYNRSPYYANTLTMGIYYPGKGYCVHTEGRTTEAINQTECHEYTHWLIDNQSCYELDGKITCREHFCKDER